MNSLTNLPSLNRSRLRLRSSVLACLLFGAAVSARSFAAPALIDDFSSPEKTSCNAARLLITDKDIGGKSQAVQRFENGVLWTSGDLVPARGSPAFISLPLLLTPDARPQDVHEYTGVRMKVRLDHGMLSVQVATADVTNFDYHLAPVAGRSGELVEVRVPFKEMRRAWSEPTPLNTAAVTSVNLVVVGMAPGTFSFAVDEVGFY